MHIVNEHGIIHTIEDGAPLPAGARVATDAEAAYYEQPNSDCIAANAPKPEPQLEPQPEPPPLEPVAPEPAARGKRG